jgi:hypothetical protein
MMTVAQEALTTSGDRRAYVLLYVFVAIQCHAGTSADIAMRALGARAPRCSHILPNRALSGGWRHWRDPRGHAAAHLAAATLATRSGLVTQPFLFDALQPAILAIVILLGTLAGLLPAVLAYRMEVTENLAPLS